MVGYGKYGKGSKLLGWTTGWTAAQSTQKENKERGIGLRR